ncbi:acetyltransferase [Azoarcus sp. L1K30]|uniref:acetyltransferase n=1 Tax=Azoarcus sp. L1K30 TaxID=2820277 RepID=UPI001B810D11|nr:acetyltransferase [Azoarcus sp. L1K30]MBR0567227.1 acetyltransferase [Azoarcus sp. L1K30]
MSSMRPIIVFGDGTFASLAAYCLRHDARRTVAAFAVDRAYLHKSEHEGLPVVAFDALESAFSPVEFELIIPFGAARINGLRQERFLDAKARGYTLASYISSRACVWDGFEPGENCLVFEQAVVQPYATVGDNVLLRSGANIGHHSRVGSHAFIATGCAFGGNVTVGERAFVGVGAVLRDGIKLGERSFVGAGAVVVADTDPDGVYVGNPARKTNRSAMAVTGGDE